MGTLEHSSVKMSLISLMKRGFNDMTASPDDVHYVQLLRQLELLIWEARERFQEEVFTLHARTMSALNQRPFTFRPDHHRRLYNEQYQQVLHEYYMTVSKIQHQLNNLRLLPHTINPMTNNSTMLVAQPLHMLVPQSFLPDYEAYQPFTANLTRSDLAQLGANVSVTAAAHTQHAVNALQPVTTLLPSSVTQSAQTTLSNWFG